jgi:hypothetical protein
MHTPSLVAIAAALALGASAAFADDIGREEAVVTSKTRAQVKAEVLEARAHRQLAAAGEAGLPVDEPAGNGTTRASVQDEVRLARAGGQLAPAGETDPVGAHEFAATSDRERGEVKAEVFAARKAGVLAPAGDAYDGSNLAQAHPEPGSNPLAKLARLIRK